MKERLGEKPETAIADALADSRTLALLIARIKLHSSNTKEKKHSKQFSALLAGLEKLSTIFALKKIVSRNNEIADTSPFFGGLPRWVLQVDSQFSHYVNPPGDGQIEWSSKRRNLWNCIEATVPDDMRDQLLAWRWKAELHAFCKMKAELDESRARMAVMEKALELEDSRCRQNERAPGLLDRIKILIWSRRTKKDELQLEKMESIKQKKNIEVGETLRECERLAALVAVEVKTTCVDCGEFFPTVFEEFVRAMDNEIGKEFSSSAEEKLIENEALRREIANKTQVHESEMRRINAPENRMTRTIDGEWERLFRDSQDLIQREFLCLNSFEMEQQEDARIRWKSAVEQMVKLLRTAEENMLHGRGFN